MCRGRKRTELRNQRETDMEIHMVADNRSRSRKMAFRKRYTTHVKRKAHRRKIGVGNHYNGISISPQKIDYKYETKQDEQDQRIQILTCAECGENIAEMRSAPYIISPLRIRDIERFEMSLLTGNIPHYNTKMTHIWGNMPNFKSPE